MKKLLNFAIIFAATLALFLAFIPTNNIAIAASCNYCPPGYYDNTTYTNPGIIINSSQCSALTPGLNPPCCLYTWGSGYVSKQSTTTIKTTNCTTTQICDGTGKGCINQSAPTCSVKIGDSCFRNTDCTQSASDPAACIDYKCTDANGHYFTDNNQGWLTSENCGVGTSAISCSATNTSCVLTGCCFYSTNYCNPSTQICEANCANDYNGLSCSSSRQCCDQNKTCNYSTGTCVAVLNSPTPAPNCASPNQCMYTQCSTGYTEVQGTCSSSYMVCCKSNSAPTSAPTTAPTPATTITPAPVGFGGLTSGDVKECADNASGFSALCKINFKGEFISGVVTIFFIFAIIVALIWLIWGGIRWIMSGGDKANLESARQHVIGAFVGLLIILLVYFIVNFVMSFFGLKGFNFKLPTIF